jgi:hypothetical protein
MDFWQTVLVVFRRWYVALPAFVLSLGLAAAVYLSVPKVYASTSVLVLTQPLTGAIQPMDPDRPPGIINPLLNFDQGLSMSASIVIQALRTSEAAAALGIRPGGDTTFTVDNGSSNPELPINGPFIFITGQSGSPAAASDIVARVVERARLELVQRQQNLDVPPATYVSAMVVMPPTPPQVQGGSKSRAAAAALGLGLLGSLSAVFAVESVSVARRRRLQ